jgi:hypothetical protein
MSDIACAYGPGGWAYVLSFVVGINDDSLSISPSYTTLYRSTDAGLSWSGPIRFAGTGDEEYMSVDQTGPYMGTIYMTGLAGGTLLRSTDHGRTIRESTRDSSDHVPADQPGQNVVLADGTIAMVFTTTDNMEHRWWHTPDKGVSTDSFAVGHIALATWKAGGAVAGPTRVVGDYVRAEHIMTTVGELPQLAADVTNGPFRDHLYAVWTDSREGRVAIRFAFSTDGGRSWGPARMIDEATTTTASPNRSPNNFSPAIAVNRDGVVGVVWCDRRDNPDNTGFWVRFAASFDGGRTFLPSVRVSAAANDPLRGGRIYVRPVPYPQDSTGRASVRLYVPRDPIVEGDKISLSVGQGGTFWPVWIDNRTGTSQVWTASIRVPGAPLAQGAAADSSTYITGSDVTARTLLRCKSGSYMPASLEVSAVCALENRSATRIRLPLTMLIDGDSAHGNKSSRQISDGPNGNVRVIFGGVSPGLTVLRPGQRTRAERLAVTVTDPSALDTMLRAVGRQAAGAGLATLRFRVYQAELVAPIAVDQQVHEPHRQ